jgi:purine nucleosidase
MTVADFRAPAPADCTTQVAVDLDHEKFWNLVTDAIVRIGDPTTGAAATTAATPAAAGIAGEAK